MDRAGLMIEGGHYRRSLAWLRPRQIPPGYRLNLAVLTSAATTLLGFVLAGYLLFT